MEKMLNRRTSLHMDAALYRRIHTICIEVGTELLAGFRTESSQSDPFLAEQRSHVGVSQVAPGDDRPEHPATSGGAGPCAGIIS